MGRRSVKFRAFVVKCINWFYIDFFFLNQVLWMTISRSTKCCPVWQLAWWLPGPLCLVPWTTWACISRAKKPWPTAGAKQGHLTPSLPQPVQFLGSKMHGHACTQYSFQSFNIYFQCCVFWWKSSLMSVLKKREEEKKAEGFQILHLYLSFSSDTMVVKGFRMCIDIEVYLVLLIIAHVTLFEI